MRTIVNSVGDAARRFGFVCFFVRGWPWQPGHSPKRIALGFECADCGLQGSSFEDLGFAGFVSSTRTVYDRDSATITRTQDWERSQEW
jgi:hypothetical protein